jgi:hypothetical protein
VLQLLQPLQKPARWTPDLAAADIDYRPSDDPEKTPMTTRAARKADAVT